MKYMLWLIPTAIVWASSFLWHILEANPSGWYVVPYWATIITIIIISAMMITTYIEKKEKIK